MPGLRQSMRFAVPSRGRGMNPALTPRPFASRHASPAPAEPELDVPAKRDGSRAHDFAQMEAQPTVRGDAALEAGEPVYQLQTRIYYAPPNNKPGASVINSTSHRRTLHNTTQRHLAAYQSGYDDHNQANGSGANICNHHVSYAAIANAVLSEVHTNTANQQLGEAVHWVDNTYNANRQGARNGHNGAFGYTFGAFPAANIPNLGGFGPAAYDEFTAENEIDDMIFNLANDPQNLFYWPATTGGDPDRPTPGTGNNSPLIGNNVTAAGLTTTLNNYRHYLQNTLGLGVP